MWDELAHYRIGLDEVVSTLEDYQWQRPGHDGAVVYGRDIDGRTIRVVILPEGERWPILTVYVGNDGRWCLPSA